MGLFASLQPPKCISVEPTQFFASIGLEIMNFLVKNLYIQKVCRVDTSIEPDLDTPCDDEKRALAFVSIVINNSLVPAVAMSLIFILFASMYSDLAGKKRKIFIMIAQIGMILWVVSAIVPTIFWSWSPMAGVIANVFLLDVFGGFLSLQNFIYAYVFDSTSNENRLLKITVLGIVHNLATLIGKGSAGFLLRRYRFLYSFYVCLVLLIMAMISTIVFVREERGPTDRKVSLKQIFSFNEIGQIFKIILFPEKKKENVRCIWLLQIVSFLIFFSFFGKYS